MQSVNCLYNWLHKVAFLSYATKKKESRLVLLKFEQDHLDHVQNATVSCINLVDIEIHVMWPNCMIIRTIEVY